MFVVTALAAVPVINAAGEDINLVTGQTTEIRNADVEYYRRHPAVLAVREITLPDVGANANVVMSEGAQTINGAKTFNTTVNCPDINAGASGKVGTVDVFPATAAKGNLRVAAVDNGADVIVTLSNAAHAAAAVYSFRDSGAATGIVPTGTKAAAYTQTYSTAVRTVPEATATAIAAADIVAAAAATATAIAAAVPAAAPAGGTGAAAGAWDTAANRDAAIVTINDLRAHAVEMDLDYEALLVDVADIRTKYGAAVTLGNELKVDYTALVADVLELKKLINALVDDSQAFGIAG